MTELCICDKMFKNCDALAHFKEVNGANNKILALTNNFLKEVSHSSFPFNEIDAVKHQKDQKIILK